MGRRRQPLDPERCALSERMRGIARHQGGVITAAQCAGLGATASDIRRLLGCGEWHRVRRGIYADTRAAGDVDPHLRRCAAVLAGLRAAEGVASHLSAARILGLPLPPAVDGRVSLTRRPPAPTSGPRSTRGGFGVTVHLTDYDDADVVEVDGVPVLAGPRLVLDCCAVVPPDSALAIADAAVAKRITTLDALVDAADRLRGRAGAELSRLVVARTDPLSDNWFESSSRWWLREAGLPKPELQVPFTGPAGLVRVDMLIRDTWTVGEADGAGKYDEPGVLFAEKRREDWLRDAHRLEVVRWVPAEMRTSRGRCAVADRFWRAFARGRRAG
jgi:hypothetical protein